MRKRVLIIENEVDTQDTLQSILEMAGCDVEIATDGLVALEKLEEVVKPDLIFLDLMMPRMDGYTFVQELRGRGMCPSVPIIVISGNSQVRQQVRKMGMDVFISKPFEIDEVLDVVNALAEP